jgi:hypothetical protein
MAELSAGAALLMAAAAVVVYWPELKQPKVSVLAAAGRRLGEISITLTASMVGFTAAMGQATRAMIEFEEALSRVQAIHGDDAFSYTAEGLFASWDEYGEWMKQHRQERQAEIEKLRRMFARGLGSRQPRSILEEVDARNARAN